MTDRSTTYLVHGFTNNPTDFSEWINTFVENKLITRTIPFTRKETIFEPIENYAYKLHEEIEKTDPANPIYLIGYSMGGLVVRYYLQHLYCNSPPIATVFTVATPHFGTDLASWAVIGGSVGDLLSQLFRGKTLIQAPIHQTTVIDLSPLSSFIKNLNNITPRIQKLYSSILFYNIWLQNDGIILPVCNAIFSTQLVPSIVNYQLVSAVTHREVLQKIGKEEILDKLIIKQILHKKQLKKRGIQTIEEWKSSFYDSR